MLPPNCRAIFVTDAGFRTPWFKQVKAFGWDWVGRIRNRHEVKPNRSNTRTASAPETTGILGMFSYVKGRQQWTARDGQREFLEVKLGGLA